MGRQRKPIELQQGNITQLQKERGRREGESVTAAKNRLARPPKWLIDDVAVKEWKVTVKELKAIDMVGNLDVDNLGGYCNAFSLYLRVTEALADAPLMTVKVTKSGSVKVRNPLIDVQKMYADEMRKFARLCGLTLDSRLKAAATKTAKAEDELKQKFGI